MSLCSPFHAHSRVSLTCVFKIQSLNLRAPFFLNQGALKDRAPGTGGPSGCKEAWITALGGAKFLRSHVVSISALLF
jgi:hypothetical protein